MMTISNPLPGDSAILRWLNQQSSPGLDTFFVTITDAGGAIVVGGVTLAVSVVLAKRGRMAAAAIISAGVLGASLLNVALKLLFERSRPELWEQIITEESYSFPSGHAMASSALAYCLVAILWHSRWRWWALVIGAVYTVGVGLSRLYLGVHYPSDVVAGWVISLLWVALVCWSMRRLRLAKS